MNMIKDYPNQIDTVVNGQFFLRRVKDRVTRSDKPYGFLLLEDATGQVPVYAWQSSGTLAKIPRRTPTFVAARLHLRTLNGAVVANLQDIYPLETHEITNAAALLPHETCPAGARQALGKLVRFNATLQPPALRGFLNRVLADPAIGYPMLTCRASQKDHHSHEGGLLTHSMEVLSIADDMARDRLDDLGRAVVQLGALFHDAGKIRSVGTHTVRPVHTQIVRHETQTHRLLEPHLHWLRERMPEAAVGLDYVFDFIGQSKANRGNAGFVGAESIEAADKMSTALAKNKRLADFLGKVMPQSSLGRVDAKAHAQVGYGVSSQDIF